MRKWSVKELDSIETDIAMIRVIMEDDRRFGYGYLHLLDSVADCAWLEQRVSIRAEHGTRTIGRCDGCSHGDNVPVVVVVDEYHDEMGAPSNLGISQVCNYHVQNN